MSFDRETARRELQETEAELLAAVREVKDWSAGNWSAAQVCEHILISESRIGRMLRSPILRFDDPTPVAWEDHALYTRVASRERKAQAPEPLVPTGKFTSAEEFVAAFQASREELGRWVASTEIPLRDGRFPHPMLGMCDGYQWLLFIAAHCRRHTAQLRELGL